MPVLGQDDRLRVRHKSVDPVHDIIPAGHGKRATRAEVFLHIDYNQGRGHDLRSRVYLHLGKRGRLPRQWQGPLRARCRLLPDRAGGRI